MVAAFATFDHAGGGLLAVTDVNRNEEERSDVLRSHSNDTFLCGCLLVVVCEPEQALRELRLL
jgi:hypothetical protein